MDRKRAASALVKYAKEAFVENTRETSLVAPISPSPEGLIET